MIQRQTVHCEATRPSILRTELSHPPNGHGHGLRHYDCVAHEIPLLGSYAAQDLSMHSVDVEVNRHGLDAADGPEPSEKRPMSRLITWWS